MSRLSERQVVIDSLGVGIGVGLYGITFGALATTSGLTVLQTCVLSLLAFTGASQFAFIGVLASGGTAVTAAGTGILLGVRNTFYSMALAKLLNQRGMRRVATAQLVIDESTAMALARSDEREARLAFWWTGGTIFVIWNLMTLIGAVAGNAIGDPKAWGLDAAVGAAFLGLLWPRLNTRPAIVWALVGALTAVVFIPFTASGFPIIIGGTAAVILGLVWRTPLNPGQARND